MCGFVGDLLVGVVGGGVVVVDVGGVFLGDMW